MQAWQHGGGDHLESCFCSTSVLTMCVSMLLFTPGLQLRTRHGRALHGHAVATSASAVRERKVVLRFGVGSVPPLYKAFAGG